MPGLGDDSFGILEVKEMKGRPRQEEARELLERLCDQVKPICVAHGWKVRMMEEFVPQNAGFLGVNINRGQKIRIRLRPPSDEGNFYPFENVLDTLLHELVHNEIGPHNAKFLEKWDELRAECEKLIRAGITGRNMPFAGSGQSLGGGRAPADARAAALKAAEKRQRHQGVMPSGGQRLGGRGDGGGGGGGLWGASSSTGSGSAKERAAAAAEWRHAISRGCGSDRRDSAAAEGQKNGDWECQTCTLLNDLALSSCGVCGAERSVGGSAGCAGAGAGGGGGGGSCGDASGSIGCNARGGSSGGREKRPAATITAGGLASASRTGALRKTASAQSVVVGGCSLGARCVGVGTGTGTGGSGTGGDGGGGLPAPSTWTCRECPFAFPTAAERRTCESCGAPRQPANEKAGNGSGGGGGGVSGMAGAGELGTTAAARPCGRGARDQELSPWACGRCTVVNAGIFLACGTCSAERSLGGGGAATEAGGKGGKGERGGGGHLCAPIAQQSFGSGRVLRGEEKACRMCTLRNASEAPECAACGIPFAESDIAAAAAAAAAITTAAGAQTGVGVPTTTGGGGGGGCCSADVLALDGDCVSGDHPGAATPGVAPNEPECIDLS